jgi:hypothetical protein
MEKEKLSENLLDKLVKFGQVFALFVSPIAVAFVGLKAQSAVAETGAKKDLVQVAVQVLKEPRRPDDGAIRKWASEVINKNSDVPLPSEAANQLSSSLVGMLSSNPLLQMALLKRPPCPVVDLEAIPAGQLQAVKGLQELCGRNGADLVWLQTFAGMLLRSSESAASSPK